MNQKRIELLKDFLIENPNDPFLKYALAKEYEKSGDEKWAIEMLEALTEEHPDYIGTYYHLGKIYERNGDFDSAIAIYKSGIDIAKVSGDKHALGELIAAKLGIED